MSFAPADHHGDVPPIRRKAMRVVAVFSEKGGSGKSTLSIHLAGMAARGHKVLLVDADAQGTVEAWGAARTRPEPLVVRADPANITEVLSAARQEGFELVLVDCPPRAVAGTAVILRLVDHVVTPVQATMPDILAAQRTVALAAAAGKPLSFVVNRAPARAVEVIQAREVLERAGPVSPVTIGDRRAFARSLTESLSVNEFARDDAKAVDEIFRYWLWLDLHHWEIEKTWQRRQAA